MTKHEFKVAASVILLFALGLAVKVYRTAHPADVSLSQSQLQTQSDAVDK